MEEICCNHAAPAFSSPPSPAMIEVGHVTVPASDDSWLPITESRNGNAYYSALHSLSSGIGFQALSLPVAFAILGWSWGILCLSVLFWWQLYTTWLLTRLHEAVPGIRHSRFLALAKVAFGPKLGRCLAQFPTMYLSAGTCFGLVIIGGQSLNQFYRTLCGPNRDAYPVTPMEWHLVFVCFAIVLAQLPNLNSLVYVSLVGAATAVTNCTLIWALSVGKGRLPEVSYDPVESKSISQELTKTLDAIGIIALAFRGHNLVLEIQGSMSSSVKHPSHEPMWKGVKFAYLLIALCLFPLAIAGFWAYGNLIPPQGMLAALYQFHEQDTSRALLGFTSLLLAIHLLCSFQLYAMPVFDNLESIYTSRRNRPCPRWFRSAIRAFFGCVAFFMSSAIPFFLNLAVVLGPIALPVTLAYPCFMWILIEKPKRYTAMWWVNWSLGIVGICLCVILLAGGIWTIVVIGLKVRFFKPQ